MARSRHTDSGSLAAGVFAVSVALALLSTLGSALQAWAPTGPSNVVPVDTGDDAATARIAVSTVSAARELLRADSIDVAHAIGYLKRARRLLASLNRGANAPAADDRITLYSLFDVPDASDERTLATKTLHGLAGVIRRGEHSVVIDALRRSGLPFVYHYLDLPVSETMHEVDAALDALRGNDGHRALSILDRLAQELRDHVVAVNDAVVPSPGNLQGVGDAPGQ